SGKKCRHLNTAGVDIGGGEGKVSPINLITHQFLRHNRELKETVYLGIAPSRLHRHREFSCWSNVAVLA
ncbi:hypothetical protein, partial [Leptolyngbya sp. FACHB-671]|uniref:hypothetical protein n=1 Tax=Leptolyngbya sp. FACHB-671 TaxID=2692812 RepID=UPI001A7E45DA